MNFIKRLKADSVLIPYRGSRNGVFCMPNRTYVISLQHEKIIVPAM
ncbi:hypothetical protein HMPREF1981_03140 [Bacteroides pyogenes F0041]|uniref:Uncharacterized protein n=1 Tax=Bacteroides pyogenes F0041 TaxID=1321819 RepID=U2CAE7_9BACE|nr:hypothetical protein HMPREF1981_03140 [Bacteroides pyogenes F0041]